MIYLMVLTASTNPPQINWLHKWMSEGRAETMMKGILVIIRVLYRIVRLWQKKIYWNIWRKSKRRQQQRLKKLIVSTTREFSNWTNDTRSSKNVSQHGDVTKFFFYFNFFYLVHSFRSWSPLSSKSVKSLWSTIVGKHAIYYSHLYFHSPILPLLFVLLEIIPYQLLAFNIVILSFLFKGKIGGVF